MPHSAPPPPDRSPAPEALPPERGGLGYWIGFAVGFAARWTLRVGLLLALCLLIAYFLIGVPAVQRYAARQVSGALTEALGVEARVDRIRLEPFTSLGLDGLYLADERGDTLVAAASASASFFRPLRSLLQRTLYVDRVALRGARVRLVRNAERPGGNFAFLAGRLRPEPNPDVLARDPFQLDLRQLSLADARVTYDDALAGASAKTELAELELLLDLLDLPGKRIEAASVELDGLRADVVYGGRAADTGSATAPPLREAERDVGRPFLGPWTILVDDLALTGMDARLRGDGIPPGAPPIRALRDLRLEVSELALTPDSLGLVLEQLAFDTDTPLRLYELRGERVSLTASELLLEGLSLQTASSRLGDRLRVTLPAGATWGAALRSGSLELDLQPSSVAVSDVVALAPRLADLPLLRGRLSERLRVSGRLRGNARRLRVDGLDLRLPDGTSLRANLSSRDLTRPEESSLNVEVEALRTSVGRLRDLLPAGARLPPELDRLGELRFAGRFDGFLRDFVAYGDLATDLGRLTVDTRVVARRGEAVRYSGEAALLGFDVGAFAAVADLGRVTARADIREGRGVRPGEIYLDVIGSIDELAYRGYTYRDVALNGQLSPEGFDGALRLADEHADLDFDGKVRAGEGAERLDFVAAVRRLDLAPLGLSREPWSLRGDLEVRTNTLDVNNLEGRVAARGFTLAHADGRRYRVDSLVATQAIAPSGEKRLSFDSPLLQADLSGQYRLLRLPGQLRDAAAETYPELYAALGFGESPETGTPDVATPDTPPLSPGAGPPPLAPTADSLADAPVRVSLDLRLLAIDSLLEALRVPVSNLAGTQATLTLDTEAENLDLSLASSLPRVAGLDLTNLGLDLRGQSGELETDVRAERVDLGAYGVVDLRAYAEYADGDLRFSVSADTATSVVGDVNLAGAILLQDTAVAFTLDPSSHVDIGGDRWVVEPGNELLVGNKRLQASDLELRSGDRYVAVETVGLRGLNVLMRQFDVSLANAYLNPEKLQIAGELDLYFSAEDIYAQEGLTLSASVDTFAANGVDWGALQMLVTLPHPGEPLAVYTTFSRAGQQAVLDGVVALQDGVSVGGQVRPRNYFDASLTSSDFDMSFLGYFIPGITDLEGEIAAAVRVYGTPDAPVPEGGVLVEECALTIDYLKTRYFVDSQFVRIDARSLDATGRQITDRFGNVATIRGGLVHEDLKVWGLDVALRTERLLVLQTQPADNPLYYGTALARGRVAFSGPFNQTDIDIDAEGLAGSRVVFPVSGTSAEDGLRFIRFRQPADTLSGDGAEVAAFLRGINLDMDVRVTPAAEVLIVFDEAAGDILRGFGTGDIQIDVRRSGEYTMFGRYVIDRGDYLFTLLNVVNKPFAILPGGTINWDGDPFEAQLDITAAYEGLSAAPIGLIPEYQSALEARGGGLVELANQPTSVDLFMELEGNLQRPSISFAIELPDLQADLRNYVNAKLGLIRSDPDELNRQVFGLVVIGQFLPSFTDIQASTVGFNTISELFSNQFSYLLSELFTSLAGGQGALSGIDVDINLQNNSSLAGSNSPNLGNDLSTNLRTYFFDDRLVIDVGANFGRTVANPTGAGTLTAGRFEVSYALTDDRRLRLKTFASTNVDIANSNRNRAGVGLSWRRQFDSFAELFGAARQVRRREETQPRPRVFRDAGD